MRMRLIVGSAAFCFAATAWAQEEDAKMILKKALDSSAHGGGIVFEGKAEIESPLAQRGVKMAELEGGLAGKFAGRRAPNGGLSLKLENDKGTYELFRSKDKIVQRQTWTTTQSQVGAFPDEVSSFLSFSSLAKNVDKAKELKKAGPAKGDPGEFEVVKGQFPIGVVSEESEDEHAPFKMWELRKIEATFYIDKKEGKIRKMEIALIKRISSKFGMFMPGGGGGKGDEDEDDEDGGKPQPGPQLLNRMRTTTRYTYTITEYGERLELKIPDELKSYLKE